MPENDLTVETNEPTDQNNSPATPPNQQPSAQPAADQPVAAQTAQQHPKKNKAVAISIAIVIGAIVLLGAGIGGGMLLQNATNSTTSTPSLPTGSDGNTAVTQEERSIAAVVEKINPSVVSIVATTQARSYYSTTEGSAAGTGIIVSKDGYVMTNNHVIENTSNISIIDSEGNKYQDVKVVGRDPLNDVAFLKITTDKELTAAELGNSSTLRTGQQVVAIGNALGQYSNSVTSGIVSGTGRPITASSEGGATESLTDLIQTDASINPGNSGGPLVNMAGQVIGINTAIVEDANGIGFAIPINATKGILAGVLETGKVSRAYLGVNYLTITPDVAEQYNLKVKQGAYIFGSGSANPVASDSPAAKAGLQKGDIITKIGDQTLGQSGGLSSAMGIYRPGDTVKITFIRGTETKTVDVTFSAYTE